MGGVHLTNCSNDMIVMIVIFIIRMVIVVIVVGTIVKVVIMSNVGHKFLGGYSMHLGS